VIGQEELPLRGALAWAEARSGHIAAERETSRSNAEEIPKPEQHGNIETPEVTIENQVVPGRTGRPRTVEKYPFAALNPVSTNEAGELSGPCFLIPTHANPERCVAAAHKRHRGKKFITRKVPGGTMVWRRS
jgi:hypothetical protein